jgi:HAD superfamily hydrolase (TIGR01509 family)
MTRPALRGVIFDLDGTLVHEELDFEAIRAEIGLRPATPLLEALATMADGVRRRAEAIIDRHEAAAARLAVALPGVPRFLDWLDDLGVRRAVLTRNSGRAARAALAAAGLGGFEPVIARDDAPFKPDPSGIHAVCRAWDFAPGDVAMIGDYLFDLQAGAAAGCATVLVAHGRDLPFAASAGLVIDGFDPLPDRLSRFIRGVR